MPLSASERIKADQNVPINQNILIFWNMQNK